MAGSQQPAQPEPIRGLLARPLDALVFLLPLIVFYEIASIARPDRVIAFDLMRRFFELFGYVGIWAPGLAVVVILLATHTASGEKWVIHWTRVGRMYLEAAALAVPLLFLNWTIPLQGEWAPESASLFDKLATGVGAGVYEELVFRLVFISLATMIGVDLLRLGRRPVALAAILLSSLAFAGHHHQPVGVEPFNLTSFAFRVAAGTYLAIIFWYRGYGPAAGCHAAYNVGLVGADAVLG